MAETVTIHHEGYPHLVRNIFDHASRSALIALRGVSRAFRDEADSRLAEHIVVTSHFPAAVTGRLGRIPGLFAPEGTPPSKKRDKYVRTLRGTRIVDVLGHMGDQAMGRSLLDVSLVGIQVVRLRRHPGGRLPGWCPFVAPTLVTFTTFSEVRQQRHDHPAIADVCPAPEGVGRSVLVLRYDPARVWLSQAYVTPFSCPASLREMVIIFTAKTTHREDEVNQVRQATRRAGMLNTVVFSIASSIPRVKYTLVDAHQLRPAWLGVSSDRGSSVEEDILDAVLESLQKWSGRDPESAAAALSSITFMTRTEYHDQVGHAQFVLETIE